MRGWVWLLGYAAFVAPSCALTPLNDPVAMLADCREPQCTIRRYYIAADEILWDYAPSGVDLVHQRQFPAPFTTLRQVERRTYRKVVYREYTDETFTMRAPREPWLGLLGPVIRAQVNDIIEVVFKNRARRPYSIHPHGVAYTLANEGALHLEATGGAGVRPGHSFTYRWAVPERAGPAKEDVGSILWMYHSHHDEAKDVNAGLVGPMLIYRRGWLRRAPLTEDVLNSTASQQDAIKQSTSYQTPVHYAGLAHDLSPLASHHSYANDTDREFVIWLNVINENNTPYYYDNMRMVQSGPLIAPGDDPEDSNVDPELLRRHQFYAVNGRIFGNLNGLAMRQGERVRWHVAALGSEDGVVHVRWHGPAGAIVERGERRNGADLLPATFRTLDSGPLQDIGRWLVLSETTEHYQNGMMAWYHVLSVPSAVVGPTASEDANAVSLPSTYDDSVDQATLDAEIDASYQSKPAVSSQFSFNNLPGSTLSSPTMNAASWLAVTGCVLVWLAGIVQIIRPL